jgi:ribosomal protein S27AE
MSLMAHHLDRQVSAAMDWDRRKAGLHGMRFRSYRCPRCGNASFFIEVRRHGQESEEAVERRRAELRKVAGELEAVVLCDEAT